MLMKLEQKYLHLIVIFILFSILGWIWEGFYVGLQYGTFLNRGFFHGPWVPIYGFGATFITILLSNHVLKPTKVFMYSMGICGLLEYVTSYMQELLFHERWWDYSTEFMNINGRVCLINLIAFGLAGVVIINFVNPKLKKIYKKISKVKLRKICNALLIIFLFDISYSLMIPNIGVGITY